MSWLIFFLAVWVLIRCVVDVVKYFKRDKTKYYMITTNTVVGNTTYNITHVLSWDAGMFSRTGLRNCLKQMYPELPDDLTFSISMIVEISKEQYDHYNE